MELEERKRLFLRNHIGDKTRDQLANSLFQIYLVARAYCPSITDESPEEPWPPDLHLADVLDKYVIPQFAEDERIRSGE